jgi:biopolymer transport protein TolR
MSAISQRGSRRRTISEINMVPFIDVMLVLLIIFMVTAPLITTGVVDVPSVGSSTKQAPEHVLEVLIGSDAGVRLRMDKQTPQTTTLAELSALVLAAQAGNANTPVVISAHKEVRYDTVVKVMDVLQRAGVARVGLSVKSSAH